MADQLERIKDWIRYDPNSGYLYWIKSPKYDVSVGTIVGWSDKKGYIRFKFEGQTYSAHRYIWWLATGDWVDQIDHENGVKHDNRILNLRPATYTQNAYNKGIQKNNTTGAKGVTLRPNGKFRARCIVDGKRESLGDYDTLADAETVLNAFRKLNHKEFANNGRW